MNWLSQPRVQLALSCLTPISIPLLYFGGLPRSYPGSLLQVFLNTYESFMHISVYLVVGVTLLGACFLVLANQLQKKNAEESSTLSAKKKPKTTKLQHQLRQLFMRPAGISVCVIVLFLQASSLASYQQVVSPGWLSNPFLVLSGYRVYWPSEMELASKGLCLDYKMGEDRDPLCLSEARWDTLSSGALSSTNKEDVETVVKGLSYIHQTSGGVVVSIMGRDVDGHIDTIRMNVESLLPFFPKVSVVVFENDSADGSRQHFQRWQKDPTKRYDVDLLDCPDAVDCKFGKSHRYDAKESKDFFMSSTIGEMHLFRQRVMDHILESSQYEDYSHVLQLDLDLGISISPLGVVHSLGSVQDTAIASSCRQPWPGSLGTLAPPYDFNAFESAATRDTQWLKQLHELWCSVVPPGDRYRFVCQATSPFKFLQIIQLDRANTHPYAVASAYNGATLYPLKLIRETQPKYDAGDDGQRCEHVSFNLGLKKLMLVNPKWDMHMSPTLPGGPRGEKALRFFRRFSTLPQVALPLFLSNFIPLAILVFSVMTLGVHCLTALCGQGSRGGNKQIYKRNV